MSDHALTVRAATSRDAHALPFAAPGVRGRVLLAERDAVAIAAMALTSGSVSADPLQNTTDAVPLLRRRRYQLLRQGGDVGPAWLLLRRPAPQPAAS